MKYAVAYTDEDKDEQYWGDFQSVGEAAEWAHRNVSQWWWIIRINNKNFYEV